MSSKCCKVCGSNVFSEVLSYSSSVFSDGMVSDMPLKKIECCQCGLVQSNDIDISSYYENEYMPSRNLDTPVFNSEVRTRSELIHQWISKILQDNNFEIYSDSMILEIGCGQGFLLKQFIKGILHGVEPSKSACAEASKIANVRCAGFDTISDNEQYDLILSYCVLEHLEHPEDLLDKISQVLSEDGRAVIALPLQDVESYDLLFTDHLAHYYVQHLNYLFQKAGFVTIDFNVGYKSFENIGMFLLKKHVSSKKNKIDFIKNSNIQYCNDLIEKINQVSDSYDCIYVFGAGEMTRVILPYTQASEKLTYFIDDYHTGSNIISVENSFSLIQKSEGFINILVMVNPAHSDIVRKKYQSFNNVNLIFVV